MDEVPGGEQETDVDAGAPDLWYLAAVAGLAAVAAVWLISGGGRSFYRADWRLTEVLYAGAVVALVVTIAGLVYRSRVRER